MLPIRAILVNRIQVYKVCPILFNNLHRRLRSSKPNKVIPSSSSNSKGSEIDTNVKRFREKFKETTKTTTYFVIILIGLGVTGRLIYAVLSELLSGSSPNSLYSKALKKCIEHPQISDKLGYPISGYGEETKRGRRQHVAHGYYLDKEGKKHIRMTFHLKGTAHSGSAHLDMVETDSGNYEYRYLFVDIDDMFKTVIVVEDNRNRLNSQSQSLAPGLELQL